MGEKETSNGRKKSRKVEKKMTHRCNASTRRHAGNDETSVAGTCTLPPYGGPAPAWQQPLESSSILER